MREETSKRTSESEKKRELRKGRRKKEKEGETFLSMSCRLGGK